MNKKEVELHVALGTPHDFVQINGLKIRGLDPLNVRICRACFKCYYINTNPQNAHKDWHEWSSYSPKINWKRILGKYLSHAKWVDSFGEDTTIYD